MTVASRPQAQVVLPVMRPFLGVEEQQAAAEAVASGWIAQGPRVAAFEQAVAHEVGDEAGLRRGQGGGTGAEAQGRSRTSWGAHCWPSAREMASTASGSRRNSSASAAV